MVNPQIGRRFRPFDPIFAVFNIFRPLVGSAEKPEITATLNHVAFCLPTAIFVGFESATYRVHPLRDDLGEHQRNVDRHEVHGQHRRQDHQNGNQNLLSHRKPAFLWLVDAENPLIFKDRLLTRA